MAPVLGTDVGAILVKFPGYHFDKFVVRSVKFFFLAQVAEYLGSP